MYRCDGSDPRRLKSQARRMRELEEIAGVAIEVLSEGEEGRLAFVGATKTLGHPVEGDIGVVDVGGGSSEVIIGTVADGVDLVKSFPIGSGALTEDFLRAIRPRPPRSASSGATSTTSSTESSARARPGGGRRRQRDLAADARRVRPRVETLERGVRVLAGDPVDDVAKRFD